MPKRLRLSYSSFLSILEMRCETKGDCAFAVRVPTLWNALLEEIRSATSVIKPMKLLLTPDLDDFSFVLWIKILLILCKVLFNSFQRFLINYLHLPLLMIMTYNNQNIFVQASRVFSWDHSAWPWIYFNFILLTVRWQNLYHSWILYSRVVLYIFSYFSIKIYRTQLPDSMLQNI